MSERKAPYSDICTWINYILSQAWQMSTLFSAELVIVANLRNWFLSRSYGYLGINLLLRTRKYKSASIIFLFPSSWLLYFLCFSLSRLSFTFTSPLSISVLIGYLPFIFKWNFSFIVLMLNIFSPWCCFFILIVYFNRLALLWFN